MDFRVYRIYKGPHPIKSNGVPLTLYKFSFRISNFSICTNWIVINSDILLF